MIPCTSSTKERYEIVVRDTKTGLMRRDGLAYVGLKLARKERARLVRAGHDAEILPYRSVNEAAYMHERVA